MCGSLLQVSRKEQQEGEEDDEEGSPEEVKSRRQEVEDCNLLLTPSGRINLCQVQEQLTGGGLHFFSSSSSSSVTKSSLSVKSISSPSHSTLDLNIYYCLCLKTHPLLDPRE